MNLPKEKHGKHFWMWRSDDHFCSDVLTFRIVFGRILIRKSVFAGFCPRQINRHIPTETNIKRRNIFYQKNSFFINKKIVNLSWRPSAVIFIIENPCKIIKFMSRRINKTGEQSVCFLKTRVLKCKFH